MGFGHSTKSLRLLLSCPLLIFWFSKLGCLLVSIAMKKIEMSATISGTGDRKAAVKERGEECFPSYRDQNGLRFEEHQTP